ncbi:MAG: GNAT family N-acetyltransferase [Planctomycetaceae bacterium]|nr:GNAT family N-acetyltransferase [Planctomycetaceae bacterium]
MTGQDRFAIRPATTDDIDAIIGFIRSLADSERIQDEVEITPALLRKWVFEEGRAEVIVGEVDGVVAGFALYYTSYSTVVGRPDLYLDDLYLLPEYRGNGFGTGFLRYLAALTIERGYGRLEWGCLTWNKPAIGFYLSLGAQPMDEWTTFRMSSDALKDLAMQV